MCLARKRVQYIYSAYVFTTALFLSFGRKGDTASVMELPEAGKRELPHRARCLHKTVVKSKDKKKERMETIYTKKEGSAVC